MDQNLEKLPPKSYKRTKFLINPNFQLRLITFIAGLSVIGLGILYLANYYFFYRLQAEGLTMGLPPHHIYFEFLAEQKFYLHILFLSTACLVFLLLFLGGLFLSHKIAGPLYRLSKYVREVTEQDQQGDLKFRKGDFFQEVAEDINKLKRYYEKRP